MNFLLWIFLSFSAQQQGVEQRQAPVECQCIGTEREQLPSSFALRPRLETSALRRSRAL